MSRSTKQFHLFTLLLVAVALLPASLLAANPKIDMVIIEENGQFKIDFVNSECPGEPDNKGCVNMAQGSKNWIAWEFTRAPENDGWVVTSLQFSDDGQNWDVPLGNPCVASDFAADASTGQATSFEVLGNGKWGRNWDENDCADPYVVHYKIHARSGNLTANSDPVIKNGGRPE